MALVGATLKELNLGEVILGQVTLGEGTLGEMTLGEVIPGEVSLGEVTPRVPQGEVIPGEVAPATIVVAHRGKPALASAVTLRQANVDGVAPTPTTTDAIAAQGVIMPGPSRSRANVDGV